jgi:Arylsulfatase A and related enzymes
MYTPRFSRPRFEFIERLLTALGSDGISLEGYDIEKIRRVQNGYPVLADEMELTDDEWDIIKSWYDGAIRYLDSRVGQFVEYLRSIGEFKNTLFVVTSDHGDHFGDHGLSSHLFSVHDTLLHVPMAISPPTGEFNPGTVIDSQ